MHNCVFTCIEIFPIMMSTNAYTMTNYDHHVSHYDTTVVIPSGCHAIAPQRVLAQPTKPGGTRSRLVGPRSHVWIVCKEVLHIRFSPNVSLTTYISKLKG